jgi:hypothetical protein
VIGRRTAASQGPEVPRKKSDETDAPLKRLAQIVIALCVMAAPATVGAGSKQSATTRIEAFTKRTIGTVKSITAGDVACYFELEDAKGAWFTEMADFELCEPKQKRLHWGKRVSLTYGVEKVIGANCEGNPDCARHIEAAVIKKSETDQVAEKPTISGFASLWRGVKINFRMWRRSSPSKPSSG